MRVAKKSLGKVAKDFLQAVNCGRAALQRRVSDGTYAGFSPGRIGGWPTLPRAQNLGGPSFALFAKSGIPDSIPLEICRFPVSCEPNV